MAYAGTPTGLAQQAGASRPWKTVLAAIAVLAIGLALVIAVMFINSRAVAPATGRDDGLIEAQRDATLLAGANSKIFVSEDKPQHLAPAIGGTSLFETERAAAAAAAAAARAGVPTVPAVIDESYNTSAGVRGLAPASGRDDGLIEAQRDAALLAGAAGSPTFVSEYGPVSGVPAVIDESYYTSAGARNVPAVPADIFDPMLIDQWVPTHGK